MDPTNDDPYVQYSVKELVIALHEKIDKGAERSDARLSTLEAFKNEVKGAFLIVAFVLSALGAHAVNIF